jgi:choline dehydrogenase-like flavoprotein
VDLPAPHQATLDAICRRIVPCAYDGSGTPKDVARLVAERVARVSDDAFAQLKLTLAIFGARAAVFATVGRPRAFRDLRPELQDKMLARWATSRVAFQRMAFQGLRRAVLLAYYAEPDAAKDIGYLGPLHTRAPAFAWEGPPPGETRDDEPILRAPRLPTLDKRSRLEGVVEGQSLAHDLRLTAEVVVVGSGAGGGVAAARLAEAGHDVLVLEEGGYYAPDDLTEDEGEMTERLFADRGVRTTDDLSIAMLQGRALGGGTLVNWMLMLRTPDHVLDEWAEDFGTEGMRPRDMQRVFETIEEEVHARLVPDDAHSQNNRLLLEGARALGWRARAGRVNARGCVRAGFCSYGCRWDAKQSTVATYLPRALRAGARVYTDVRADRIEVVERHGAFPQKRVHVTVLDRKTGRPRAKLVIVTKCVVVAAGAIGSPSLLVRSGMGEGGVGRFLRLHPTTATMGIYDRDVYTAAGMPLTVVVDEYARIDGYGYGFVIECPPLHPSLLSAAWTGFGREHRDAMEVFKRTGAFIGLLRDGADRAMSNGEVTVDRAGKTHIAYRLGPADGRHLRRAIEATARLHLAAGAREVVTLHAPAVRMTKDADVSEIERRPIGPNQLAVFSAHVNGTCRIGKRRADSGTNPDGEVWGQKGVFVVDGSLLPTGVGANPQETIMAFASIIARRIAGRL